MILGIDVGGSTIKYGIFDGEKLIEKSQLLTPQSNSDDVICAINNLVKNCIEKFNINKVGIGFPSVVSKDYFVHIAPNIKDFINVDLKEKICEVHKNITIRIENDANSAALAELKFGVGKDLNNLIYITLGSGVGGAIIINKSIYYGDSYGAGEIGYTNFNFDEINYSVLNRNGILEEYLGRKQFTNYFNGKYYYNVDNTKEIFELAESNNADAIEAFAYDGKLLGSGIASVMNCMDIHNVIIGGGIIKDHRHIIPELDKSNRIKKVTPLNNKVLIAQYYEETGIIGDRAVLNVQIVGHSEN